MGEVVVRRTIARTPAEVFDVIGTHNYENHPRWEAEVLEIRPLQAGPIQLGSRAVMVRKDWGKVHETTYEVTDFQPDRRIAIRHLDGPLDFQLAFELAPASGGTELTVRVNAKPRGAMRLLGPVFGVVQRRVSNRLTDQMVGAIESRSVASAAPATA
jgi:uncharacterized protein YndB with AHSA1/START domain